MFVGHYALAFGAKRYAPTASLGVLFLACQLADLLWPNLVLLGVESFSVVPGATRLTPLEFSHYPYSHSLAALALWALLFAGAYRILARAPRAALVAVAALVLSHWLLDTLTHQPDMPLAPGVSQRFGLGLWDRPVAAVAVELGLFAAGLWLYARATRPLDRKGSVGFQALAGFLLAVYAANLAAPPPPSAQAVAWSAQAMWLLVAWGYWIDRHRAVRHAGSRAAG